MSSSSAARPVTFDGFSPDAVQFLASLAANNDRAWFTPRKAEHERLLKRPMEALCVALDQRFRERGLPLTADPTRSPFRIHRDTRFSKDKSPYKTSAAAQFPVAGGSGRPGGYLHIEPGDVMAGGGVHRPEQPVILAWRSLVATDPGAVHAAVDDPGFRAAFPDGLTGERLARVPAPYAKDHPDADLLRLKDMIFGTQLSDADIASPALPDLLCDLYAAALPVFELLRRIV